MERIDRGGGCFEIKMSPEEIRQLSRNARESVRLGLRAVEVLNLSSKISTKPIVTEDLDQEVVQPHN